MSQTIVEEIQAKKLTLEVAKLFPRQGEWTEEDYFSLPETNRIVELSRGRLIISPSPTLKHQIILGKLYVSIFNYVSQNNLGVVVVAPMDVRLWEDNIREPDIVFMSNEHSDRLTNECLGVPDLVMEILSPSNKKQDLDEKFNDYQIAGVQEYWIVNPFQQTIEVFTFATECLAKKLENGAYTQFGKWGTGEIAHSKLLSEFEVTVDKVFE